MQKNSMRNPFGASTTIRLAELEVKKDKGESSEPKTTDKVKVYMACVPALEAIKDDLRQVLDNVSDSDAQSRVQSWLEQIESMQMEILEFTQIAISQDRDESTESPEVGEITTPEGHPLAEILGSTDSEISKLILGDAKVSGGEVMFKDRAAGSIIRSIPDATR